MTKKSRLKIVTHNGGFHTDDVFAVATLMLLLGDDVEVIRTRDEEIIKTGDYIVDVGMVYDPSKKRFDHHQKEGAGKRENGIPYAAFGLVWKEFGEKVCGSVEISKSIDNRIVQYLDAGDNGFNTYRELIDGVVPYDAHQIINLYEPSWKESDESVDDKFLEAVSMAKKILKREIKKTGDWIEGENIVKNYYKNSEDKKLIVVDKEDLSRIAVTYSLIDFPEPLFAVLHKDADDTWQVVCINKDKGTFELRKSLPESWRGKSNEELAKETGVSDAIFCHRAGFMCIAKSKEGAIKLAKLALAA